MILDSNRNSYGFWPSVMHHGDSNHAPGLGKALQIIHYESYEQESNYSSMIYSESLVSRIFTDCSTFISIASSSVATEHL